MVVLFLELVHVVVLFFGLLEILLLDLLADDLLLLLYLFLFKGFYVGDFLLQFVDFVLEKDGVELGAFGCLDVGVQVDFFGLVGLLSEGLYLFLLYAEVDCSSV